MSVIFLALLLHESQQAKQKTSIAKISQHCMGCDMLILQGSTPINSFACTIKVNNTIIIMSTECITLQ